MLMQQHPIYRAAVIWLLIAVLAVVNGLLRESVLVPLLGHALALPLSGLSLSLIVIVVTYLSIPFLGDGSVLGYWLIGVQWVVMTLAFEFLFGHFVVGTSWSALLETFNLAKGDLFSLVLLVSLCSPYLLARFRGRLFEK